MRPSTRMQREIVKLSKELPRISKAQEEYIHEKCFESYAYRTKKGVTTNCLECGHRWETQYPLYDSIYGCICPHCGRKLKTVDTRQRVRHEIDYLCVLTTCRQYQVVRYFYIKKYCKVGQKAKYDITEVVQRWISHDGHAETIARLRPPFCYYMDLWCKDSGLELRKNNQYDIYDISAHNLYCKKRILPVIKRNGFTGELHGLPPARIFTAILRNSKQETLLKSGQISMLKYSINTKLNLDTYWPSIRICIRRRYLIEDASLWVDYIDLLRYFGKDLTSEKYVCPKDLKGEHDKLTEKKRDELHRQEVEKKREKALEYETKYLEQKSRFFGLSFTDGEIQIRVLESVSDFLEEGVAMHHCVFDNEYFLKEDSLILSATLNEERLETIELSLKTMKVIQSRGVCNSFTQYHQRILDLVTRNIHLIKNAS